MGLIDKIQFVPSTQPRIAIATTGYRSSIVDMDGAEGCIFAWMQSSGATSGGVTAFRVLGSSANSTAGMVHMHAGTTGSVVTMSSAAYAGATMDNKFVAIDVVKPAGNPAKRYVMLAVDNSSTINSILAIKYGLRLKGDSDITDGSSQILATTSIVGAATS